MTDHSDLIERLRKLKVWDDHPSNQSLGDEAADALSSQSLSLSEAREEIERLKGLVAGIRECPQEPRIVEAVARAIDPRQFENNQGLYEYCNRNGDNEDWARRCADGMHPLEPVTEKAREVIAAYHAALSAPSALENVPAVLADATNDPASSDLSSLRKGAEVAVKSLEWHRVTYGWLAFEEWYRIEDQGPNWPTERYWLYEHGERLGKFDTFEQADATMFARHEHRIRSALVSGSREDGADA